MGMYSPDELANLHNEAQADSAPDEELRYLKWRREFLRIACRTAGLAPWIIRDKFLMWRGPDKRRTFLFENARRFSGNPHRTA